MCSPSRPLLTETTQNSLDAMIGSDALIPADLIADLAKSAKLRPLFHPADAAPERGYAPSQALADLRPLPRSDAPVPRLVISPRCAVTVDHTVPLPRRRSDARVEPQIPLPPSSFDQNLLGLARSAVARRHRHTRTSPSEQTYVTTPGSALLFPSLCTPTGALDPTPQRSRCTDRDAMMPKRRRTRAQHRTNYIATQRRRNRRSAR